MIRELLSKRPIDATHVDCEGFFIKCINGHVFESKGLGHEWKALCNDDLSLTNSLSDLEFIFKFESLLHRVNDLINSGIIEIKGVTMEDHILHGDIKSALNDLHDYKPKVLG